MIAISYLILVTAAVSAKADHGFQITPSQKVQARLASRNAEKDTISRIAKEFGDIGLSTSRFQADGLKERIAKNDGYSVLTCWQTNLRSEETSKYFASAHLHRRRSAGSSSALTLLKHNEKPSEEYLARLHEKIRLPHEKNSSLSLGSAALFAKQSNEPVFFRGMQASVGPLEIERPPVVTGDRGVRSETYETQGHRVSYQSLSDYGFQGAKEILEADFVEYKDLQTLRIRKWCNTNKLLDYSLEICEETFCR